MDDMRELCIRIFGTDDPDELRAIAKKARQYDAAVSGIRPHNERGAGRKASFSPEMAARMGELYRSGMGVSAIAKEFHTSRQTVYKYLGPGARAERGRDITLRIHYMYRDTLCTVIDVDVPRRKIYVTNETDDLLHRAFGILEKPGWEEFERFLRGRCFPPDRAFADEILKGMGLEEYDPLRIVQRTQGRMAGDFCWMEFFYQDELGR